jgi:uncharacterized protein (AIM24 family)
MANFTRLPQIMPEQPAESRVAGLACRILGDRSPSLAVDLEPGQSILFHPAAMLWKEASILLHQHSDTLIQADGPGRIGFGPAHRGSVPGMIFPIPLAAGDVVQIQSAHYLLAYNAMPEREQIQALGERLAGRAGFELDRFTAGPEGGVVWVQAHGDVFERGLLPGEPLDIQHEAWLCKDASVELQTIHPSDDPNARHQLHCLRLSGPGRIAFQTGRGQAAAPLAAASPAEAVPPGRQALRAVAGSLLGRFQP